MNRCIISRYQHVLSGNFNKRGANMTDFPLLLYLFVTYAVSKCVTVMFEWERDQPPLEHCNFSANFLDILDEQWPKPILAMLTGSSCLKERTGNYTDILFVFFPR